MDCWLMKLLLNSKIFFDQSIIDVDINSKPFIPNIDVSILLIADGIIIRIVIVVFFCYQIVAHMFVDFALSMSALFCLHLPSSVK